MNPTVYRELTKMGVAISDKTTRIGKRANGNFKTNGKKKPAKRQQSDYLDPEQLLNVLDAVRRGDFSSRLPSKAAGDAGLIYNALNEIIERNEDLTAELNRISEVVGREGKIAERATLEGASGGWASC